MKIEEVRTSFTVYLIASELERLDGIAESLRLAGYMAASFGELTAAFSEFPSNPPHFLLFDAQEAKFNLKKAIKQVQAQLPESHIFLVSPVAAREHAVAFLEFGVYDIIYTPVLSQTELLSALDRAAERDYLMYANERLSQAQPTESQGPPVDKDDTFVPAVSGSGEGGPGLAFAMRLFQQKSPDECISMFMEEVSTTLSGCGVLYFKYIANRRVLLAAQALNLSGLDINGLGVDFNQGQSQFRTSQLRDPQSIHELAAMVNQVFGFNEFMAYPIEVMGDVHGVAVFLRGDPEPETTHHVMDALTLLGKAMALQESEKRLHVLSTKDPGTDLLNRQNFLSRVQQEISRARRTMLPVSLVMIAVDQYAKITAQMGPEEAQTVLRMAARIFEKHSRVNDIIGRTGADEFGIILPHTGWQGALIKAERLRRIIESADFSRVLKTFPHITVSLGVSEYPTLVRDAEELVQAADEALYQVRAQGNKTCVAKPGDGFVPDFEVHEKGLS